MRWRRTYLESSELDGFLTDVVSVEGSNEVVDGDAHDVGGGVELRVRRWEHWSVGRKVR